VTDAERTAWAIRIVARRVLVLAEAGRIAAQHDPQSEHYDSRGVDNLNMAVLLFVFAIGLAALLGFYAVLLAERANTSIDATDATADDHGSSK
jgi:hypothetical protein